jgi:YegS/Rv2252/BmrU family lipid kinase
MPQRSYYVIVNPAAARGAALRASDRLLERLRGEGHEYESVRTERRGHAVALAAEAARAGWGAVVAVGGDGTVHEVANGLLRASGVGPTVPLGIVPAGSGNDFALLANVPLQVPAAIDRLLAAEPRAVDAGRVGAEWFTNGIGIGLDARVAVEVQRRRRLRGLAMYLTALVSVLRTFRPPHLRVEVDGELAVEGPMTLVTVGNGARHGGGFWLCPDARIDDGLLDICTCDALSTLGILSFLPRVMRGSHTGAACVRMLRGTRVRVTSTSPVPAHADGEILGEGITELEIELVPGRLRILA